MTRFRAYISDSEDEYLSEGPSEAAEDDALEYGLPSKQPGVTAAHDPVADEAETDDDLDELQSLASSASPPPPASRPADPTLVSWARDIGVDRQRMHVMQTALFRVPEEEAALKSISQPKNKSSVKRLNIASKATRKHGRESDGEGVRADSRTRSSFAQDIEPAPFRPSRKYARVRSSASAFTGHEDAFIDSGLSLGRSFRVGWGPGGRIIHLGKLCGVRGVSTSTANSSVVTVSAVPLLACSEKEASGRAEKLLSHNLSNTKIQPDAEGVPYAHPSRTLNFASFASLFPQNDRSYEALLFRLGHALFDPMELRLADTISVDIRNRVLSLRRKVALSKWLQEAVAASVERDAGENSTGEYGWAKTVFALLTGNQIEKACDVANDAGSVKLATLLAQAGGDNEFKEDLKAQLKLWREQKIDVHIDENVRKVYALLAGVVDVLEGSKETGLERCPDVQLTKGLDWKRIFGLHLWFGQPLDAPIASVFEAYDMARKSNASNIAPPIPWYRESTGDARSQWKLPSGAEHPDALFSLIKLFADPACSLSTVLTPFSFSASPTDSQLPWHIYILMSRCLRIRDLADRGEVDERFDAEEPEVEGHSPSADLLANSYALQLEQAGMLQEAAFVLLHLEGSAGRQRAIKEMLSRNAPRLNDWITRGLHGSLKIPVSWTEEAKAIYALNNGQIYHAYELYLSAGLYNPAHDLAVLELAPDAVIHRDLDLLKELFERFAGRAVDGWHVRGKIFLDYVHAMNRMPELREYLDDVESLPDAEIAAEVEEFTRSVPRMINLLPDILRDRSDIRHNAALAEMIAGLTQRFDRLRPLALGTHLRAAKVGEATKLHHIRATAYEKFLRTIEVA